MLRLLGRVSPYRAPELLFGPSTYDACATDLWSLGTFICQFYTPIVVSRRSLYGNLSDEPDEDEDTESTEHVNGYIIPSNINPKAMLAYNTTWMRQTLFDATKGTIGLAWSIFKVFGSPSKDNWPVSEQLFAFRFFHAYCDNRSSTTSRTLGRSNSYTQMASRCRLDFLTCQRAKFLSKAKAKSRM